MKKQIGVGLAAVLLLLAALAFCVYWQWSGRAGSSRDDVLALMPSDASAVIFADLGELRRAPFFAALSAWAPKPQAEAEYLEFLRATGFDYERDLDRVAIATEKHGQESAFFAVADGRFDRKKITGYAWKSGTVEKLGAREFFSVPVNGSARRISFTFLRNERMALTNDANLAALFDARPKRTDTADWRTRFERLAGSPVFAVIRQDAEPGEALAAQAPGGLRSPQLSALLDQLQWITVAGKPESDLLRIVTEGECMTEGTVRQLADLLNGIVVLAQAGLNDAKTRQQLDPAAREAYLELLKSADVRKIDRGDTKSVRLVFDLTPKFLEAVRTVTPGVPAVPANHSKPGRKTPGT